ncbi:MAG: peptidase M16 [Crocinitomicaceae bacterium]|nr:peptidase M16 [Crocinitomicaceae bacterium]
MKIKHLLIPALALLVASCNNAAEENSTESQEKFEMKTTKDSKGREYTYVTNDPMKVRIYTLANGLKIYLTQNKNEPTIQTLIPVKAGSTYDPKETTGLAHYLEHLMFKGTQKLGTQNWEKESALLDQISNLYEQHKAETNPEKKKAIYAEIDRVSGEAAKFAISNEYDKAISTIGGSRTNAFTSNERTVYMNTIPANELERWIILERERFGALVMRFFHTELETVYEEFNRGQDQDGRKVYYAMFKNLFPGHPYGEQTTIGEAEHLKNPSMVNIRNYFDTYYAPNNMAICLSGDFEYEEAAELIEKHWGDMKANEGLTHPTFGKIPELSEIKRVTVLGPDKENVSLAFRLEGMNTKDADLGEILSQMLYNGKAGMLDLNLNQQQKVLQSYAYTNFMLDYGFLTMYATLRDGQSMEEAESLLLDQLNAIKKGEFEAETLEAIINNMKVEAIEKRESNWRAFDLMDAFISGKDWLEVSTKLNRLEKITKDDIVKFANERFADNYVAIYKKVGEDTNTKKVEKPQITPVDLNKSLTSDYLSEFSEIPSSELKPVFLDFDKDIKQDKLNNIDFRSIKNEDNELFNLMYVYEMGSNHDKVAALAFDYLEYLGTTKYSAEDLQKEFYKNGLRFGVYSGDRRTYVYMSGLKKSTEKGIELLEHILADAQPDSIAYVNFINGLMKKRADAKREKRRIQGAAMPAYAKYGKNNPVTNILSESELNEINPSQLTDKIHELTSMEHHIFYYGNQSGEEAKELVAKYHPKVESLKPIPASIPLVELDQTETKVHLVHWDQVQAEVLLVCKDQPFDVNIMPLADLYNSYYGRGLSSIVFQEIREAKGLAYTAYSSYVRPKTLNESYYLQSYFGAQSDKLGDAMTAMMELLNEMPQVENQFEASKKSIMKRIASDRRIKDRKFFTYLSYKQLGLNNDVRKTIYEEVQKADMASMKSFFDTHVKGRSYTIMVLGDRNQIDKSVLEKYGPVTELSMEDIFGY